MGMHEHTGGVKELSRCTGDACRVECVVVLCILNIAEEAFDTSLVVAQVMRGEQNRGAAGEAVGGIWRGAARLGGATVPLVKAAAREKRHYCRVQNALAR